jgi:hypothetical protein
MDEDNVISEIVETGSDITGSVGSIIVGGLIAGPIGAIIGGVSGPIITRTLKAIGKSIKQKILTEREEVRVGAVYFYAIEQFNNHIDNGKSLVSPLLNINVFGRNSTEEILEGIILTAQKTYEEKKIKFIGKLYANLLFINESDLAMSNFMLNLSNDLTYRQYIIINILKNREINAIENKLEKDKNGKSIITRYDLCCEIRFLKEKGLLGHPTYYSDMEDNSSQVYFNDLKITLIGEQFYKLLGLSEIENQDIDNLVDSMNIKNSH